MEPSDINLRAGFWELLAEIIVFSENWHLLISWASLPLLQLYLPTQAMLGWSTMT